MTKFKNHPEIGSFWINRHYMETTIIKVVGFQQKTKNVEFVTLFRLDSIISPESEYEKSKFVIHLEHWKGYNTSTPEIYNLRPMSIIDLGIIWQTLTKCTNIFIKSCK